MRSFLYCGHQFSNEYLFLLISLSKLFADVLLNLTNGYPITLRAICQHDALFSRPIDTDFLRIRKLPHSDRPFMTSAFVRTNFNSSHYQTGIHPHMPVHF
jgi:hypothetical protein